MQQHHDVTLWREGVRRVGGGWIWWVVGQVPCRLNMGLVRRVNSDHMKQHSL
jgi:hypothetical protein